MFTTPVEPDTNPPLQSIVETFGFHSPHVDMSDHTRHTLSGDAVVSADVPYSRAISNPPHAKPAHAVRDAARAARVVRSDGTSTTSLAFRKFNVTTPATKSTAPSSSIGRSGAP